MDMLFQWRTGSRLPAVLSGRRSRRAVWLGWALVSALSIGFVTWIAVRLWLQPAWLDLLPPIVREFVGLAEAAGAVTLALIWFAFGLSLRRHVAQMPVLSVEALYALSPADFERYVAQLFRLKGYTVDRRGRSGDRGVDLVLRQRKGKRAIVQCKRYRNTVGAETVRELYGTLIHEQATHAFLVTSASISEAAREWARGKPMTLIDGETLVQIAGVLAEDHGSPVQTGR